MKTDPITIEKARKIKMVLLDVDGVMTNGQILLMPDGTEVKFFSIHDGFGIVAAMKCGIKIGIISGRYSPSVKIRCEELQIVDVFMDRMDKSEVLKQIAAKYSFSLEECAFVGDDLPDLPALEKVGLSAATANAIQDVKTRVDLVLEKSGGDGAVREFLDFLLNAQGKYELVLKKFIASQ
jgi:3-deoxy-D-manno-octulosonate 8-phosphate phosphatase (KDO 8-P phosphatase)